jgi:hypothetical protein
MWILKNWEEILENIKSQGFFSSKINSMKTYDFSSISPSTDLAEFYGSLFWFLSALS